MSNSQLFDLPDEVLLQIFSNLSTYDILRHVAIVCKKFNVITKDSSLIKEIHLKICHSGKIGGIQLGHTCELIETLERSKGLTKFVIEDRKYYAEYLIIKTLQSCPKLNHLEIIRCHLSEEGMEKITEFGKRIKFFNITSIENPKRGEMTRVSHVTKLKQLRHLSLNRCHFESDDLKFLASNCEELQSLEIGSLVRIQIGSPHAGICPAKIFAQPNSNFKSCI